MTTQLLKNAYDIHVHAAPDVIPRATGQRGLALAASEAGMSGILLKDHCTSTVGRVDALNSFAEIHCRFYSALALNPPVGSLNPVAVESALRAGVDVIFFPTYGAANHIQIWGAGKPPTAFPLPSEEQFKGITIIEQDGTLKQVCIEILRLIAKHDAVLGTGHISPKESLELLRYAKSLGVRRMIVTHASESVTPFTIEQQHQAANLGALIEHCFFATTALCPSPIPLKEICDQIRSVGVEHTILSSDFGQVKNGHPVEGFGHYLEKMKHLGFSKEEIEIMVTRNPRKLLGG
ncbi:MAG: hypothetical protein JRI80_06195 [Deltaproteobacteria bacterium]|nr:hypothetical protein [Deltaproteobacteria bacterium]